MTATVIRMADRCTFILPGLRPTNVSTATVDLGQREYSRLSGHERTLGKWALFPAIKEAAKEFNVAEALRDRIVARKDDFKN